TPKRASSRRLWPVGSTGGAPHRDQCTWRPEGCPKWAKRAQRRNRCETAAAVRRPCRAISGGPTMMVNGRRALHLPKVVLAALAIAGAIGCKAQDNAAPTPAGGAGPAADQD